MCGTLHPNANNSGTSAADVTATAAAAVTAAATEETRLEKVLIMLNTSEASYLEGAGAMMASFAFDVAFESAGPTFSASIGSVRDIGLAENMQIDFAPRK